MFNPRAKAPINMNIRSAKFIKGIVYTDELLDNGKPQIAFVGRSNVGKSSLINSLTGQKGLARTSSFPGRTQEINLFLINNSHYFVDLPGYGYARISDEARERIQSLIYWYLFSSNYPQKKVVVIIDANVGVTDLDMVMLHKLEEAKKDIIIVANKIDKIKSSERFKKLKTLHESLPNCKLIQYSSDKRIGQKELLREIFEDNPRNPSSW